MATVETIPVRTARRHTPTRFRPYVPIAACAIVVAFVGFWANYYGRIFTGTVTTPPIIQLHAAIFIGWLTLLTVQSTLAARGRMAQHMRVGRWVMAYGVLVFLIGLTATFATVGFDLEAGKLDQARLKLFVGVTDMATFAPFLAAAWLYRRRPEVHKRLIVVATTILLIAPAHRMHWFLGMPPPVVPVLLIWLTPILIGMAYDFFTRRIVHPVYVTGICAVLFMKFWRGAIAETAAWGAFRDWVLASYT